MPTQNVNLTPELEQFVKSQIKGGYFKNVSEVHRAALAEMARQQEERELKLELLRKEIQTGINDSEAGHYTSFDSHEALEQHLNDIANEALTKDAVKT